MGDLYYCDECLHVHYKIPENNRCQICNNELSEENTVNIFDFLVCETCHSFYSANKPEEIIPEEDSEESNALCKCRNHCPPNTLFERVKEDKQIFLVGSIVLADLYKCQNCKAIYIWNRERKQKKCLECNAKLVFPLNFNPENQKTIFRCANPEHGIRLKVRDLILEHNEEIEKNMQDKKIHEKENQLRQTYHQKEHEIKNQGGLFRRKSKIKAKQTELGEWAKNERKKLYNNLEGRALHCSVYKMNKKGEKINYIKTGNGCGALAKVRINKKIQADNNFTVFGAPKEKKEEKENKTKKDENGKKKAETGFRPKSVDFGRPAEQEEIKTGPKTQTNTQAVQENALEPTSEIEQSLEPPSETKLEESKESENSHTRIIDKKRDIGLMNWYNKFGNPEDVELILGIVIYDDSYEEKKPINYGFLFIKIDEDQDAIALGRKDFLNAYWQNVENIKRIKEIFNNISEYQFDIIKQNGNFTIKPEDTNINQIFIRNEETPEEEQEEKYVDLEDKIQLEDDFHKNSFYLKAYNYNQPYLIKFNVKTSDR